MIEKNSIMFARVRRPSFHMLDSASKNKLVGVLPIGGAVATSTYISLAKARRNSTDILFERKQGRTLEDLSVLIVADDGFANVDKLREIGETLSQHHPEVPLVLISNSDADEAMANELIGSFDAIIGFPFDDEKLNYCIRRLSMCQTSNMRTVTHFVPFTKAWYASPLFTVIAGLSLLGSAFSLMWFS